MGLDATAFSGLAKVENPTLDSEGFPSGDGYVSFYDNKDFPGRIAGIEGGLVAYTCSDAIDCFSGGYGTYNCWRDMLAQLAGYPAMPVNQYGQVQHRHDHGACLAGSGPFYEMIYFSDCDGTLGPIVCAKLAKDFAEFQERADAVDSDYFKLAYTEWRKGFELAANGGAIKFA